MTDAKVAFDNNLAESYVCLNNYDTMGDAFALKHVWVTAVSSFDLYMTELVSEVGVRWIDRTPPILSSNLRQVQIPLGNVLGLAGLSPVERIMFYKDHVYTAVRFTSFYRPDKVSEALSYIWTCPAKEKWARITARMKSFGRHGEKTEKDIRDELTLIGDRRDLIAHSADISPGAAAANPVLREDAARILGFILDLATAIDLETEAQLTA